MYSYISLFYSWFISCCIPWVRITIFQSCVYYVHIAELTIKRTLRHAGSVGENKGGAFCSHWHAVWYMDAQFIYLILPSFRCMSAEIRLWFVVYLDLVLFVFHLPVQVVFFYYFYYFGLAELLRVRFFLNLLINARVFCQSNVFCSWYGAAARQMGIWFYCKRKLLRCSRACSALEMCLCWEDVFAFKPAAIQIFSERFHCPKALFFKITKTQRTALA